MKSRPHEGRHTQPAKPATDSIGKQTIRFFRKLEEKDRYAGRVARNTYIGAKVMSAYCLENDVSDVVFMDRSARPMRAGLSEYWKLAYPKETPPDMHFINPELPKKILDFRNSFYGRTRTALTLAKIENQLQTSHSTLLDKQAEPVLLFDVCIHSGATLAATKIALELYGLTNIKIGAFSDDRNPKAALQSDLQIVPSAPDLSCRPFGIDASILNTEHSIYTTPTRDPISQTRDTAARNTTKHAIQQAFIKDTR